MRRLLAGLFLWATCTATQHVASDTPHTRQFFYAGGNYVNTTGGTIFKGQMYVEKLTPQRGVTQQYPILLLHGYGQTGTNWLNTPDGRPGWASYYLGLGYEVYLADSTYRGRSPIVPGELNFTLLPVTTYEQRFTAPEVYKLWPQAYLHSQWPGTGHRGDPAFDAFYAGNTESLPLPSLDQQISIQLAGAALLDRIGKKTIIIAHSQSSIFAPLIVDKRPNLVRAVITTEPAGPPFIDNFSGPNWVPSKKYGITDAPLEYEPKIVDPDVDFVKKKIPAPAVNMTSECILQADSPPPRKLVNYSKVPVLLITGEASFHVPYDWCYVAFLRQAGVRTDFMELGKVGIHGNGHFMHLEKNSDDIAAAIQGWIQKLAP